MSRWTQEDPGGAHLGSQASEQGQDSGVWRASRKLSGHQVRGVGGVPGEGASQTVLPF